MFKFQKWSAIAKEIAVAFIGTLVICALSAFIPVLRNLRYFEVIVHEISHSITCILFGGKVTEIVIFSPFSAYSMCSSNKVLITLSAGYIGTSIVGAILIYFANRTTARYVYLIGAVFLLIFGLTLVKQYNSSTVINCAIVFAVVIATSALSIKQYVLKWVGYLLGFSSIFFSIESLLAITLASSDEYSSDAVEFAKEFTPALAHQWISIAWLLICVYFLFSAMYFAVWIQRRTKRAEPA